MKFGETSGLSAVVYGLVGLAGLYQAAHLEVHPAALARLFPRAPARNLRGQPRKSERLKEEREKMNFILPVLLAGAVALALTSAASAADIVDTAVAGHFNTLVAAVKAAGLVDTLKGPGPFTVFAPTDEAFAKLPAGTLESLLKPENKAKLQSILTYHVVAGKSDVPGCGEAAFRQNRGRREHRDQDYERRRDGRQRARDEGRYRGQQWRDPRHRHGHPAQVRPNPEALGWRVAPGTELVRGDSLQPAPWAAAGSRNEVSE